MPTQSVKRKLGCFFFNMTRYDNGTNWLGCIEDPQEQYRALRSLDRLCQKNCHCHCQFCQLFETRRRVRCFCQKVTNFGIWEGNADFIIFFTRKIK